MKDYGVNSNPALHISAVGLNDMQIEFGPGRHLPSQSAISIAENGDVTFFVIEPSAQKVEIELRGRKGRIELPKISDGHFRATVSGLKPGGYGLSYYFDGVPRLYGRAPMNYGGLGANNFFEIPDPEETFYLYKDVPHGALRFETYWSECAGVVRGCWVYTPPSYDYSPQRRYPVVYIQHGTGGNETSWPMGNHANLMLDNLIAEGKAQEMIAVFNCGYAVPADSEDFSQEHTADCLADMIAKDCIPFIDGRFRTVADRESRAVAGYSMGGRHTRAVGRKYPDKFAWVGILGGPMLRVAVPFPDWKAPGDPEGERAFFSKAENLNQYKLMFFCIGENDYGVKTQLADWDEIRSYPCWKDVKSVDLKLVKGNHGEASKRAMREFLLRVFQ